MRPGPVEKAFEELFEELLDNTEAIAKADNLYKQTTEETWIKKTTKSLIIDEKFITSLVSYTRGKFVINNKDFTKADVLHLLNNLNRIINIYEVDPETDSGYVEDYHDGSRWEGDYNPADSYSTPRKYSFRDVISAFIQDNPTEVNWDTKEEWIKKD